MTLAELVGGFRTLMIVPGLPELLGLFGAVCVFLGSFLFSSNGHRIWVAIVTITTLIVGEELLRAVYFHSALGTLSPNPLILAITSYSVMVIGVALGYFAKLYVKRTVNRSQKDIENDIISLLETMDMNLSGKEKVVEHMAQEVVKERKGKE